MKKIGILALCVGVFCFFCAVNASAEETAMKVVAKNGKVSVKVYPSDKWTELAIGQVVHAKDMISTEACDIHAKEKASKYTDAGGRLCAVCGAVTLELPDKSTVAIKPDTRIAIEDLKFDDASRKLKVNMTKGELRMIITKMKAQSDFSVKTPNAVYGATGTMFYVKVTPTGTSVYVSEGSITVLNPVDGKTYTVTAGYMLTFNADGTVTGPVTATDTDVSGWTACYAEPTAEPYTPAALARAANVEPPNNTWERGISGG
jgi:hypothetical protein